MKKIMIFGIGALGSNLLVTLTKTNPEFEFIGIDFDIIESRNIGPQAFFLEHVGMAKVDAMRVVLHRYTTKTKYNNVRARIGSIDDICEYTQKHNPDLIIDCFDNAKSRKLFSGVSGNILHIGFSPEYTAEFVWNEVYGDPGDVEQGTDICALEHAVPFINFVVNFSALKIIDFFNDSLKKNFIITNKYIIREIV